ncbi:toll/interleukin-1 receptor domain-containing protein [Devosia sp.]|uniref:toll/interleukin-1 receptor domain-containing protein n=1 Tax=Devosia sp. TaxID=1871048 RepID=UPI001B2C5779|nr:toll/interleukin-1 receptor domain-containing protein [Devosia sp.]MBO9590625.1 toll/interleukin-1 receptor domain-containing protein [Devosia sp.]
MPLVFISHAAADKEIAGQFQKHLIGDFLGMCEVFVSSNLDSINAGQEWHQAIKSKLATADIVVGLLSPLAVTRGWVFVEFGAGWIRNIPTIPLCHSGLEPAHLPAPLNSFQGLMLSDAVHLEHLYGLVAKAVGCQPPNVDFAGRASGYKEATFKVQMERGAVGWLRQLCLWNPDLLPKLARGEADTDVLVPSIAEQNMVPFATDAVNLGMLTVNGRGMAMGTRVGASAGVYELVPLENFATYAALL